MNTPRAQTTGSMQASWSWRSTRGKNTEQKSNSSSAVCVRAHELGQRLHWGCRGHTSCKSWFQHYQHDIEIDKPCMRFFHPYFSWTFWRPSYACVSKLLCTEINGSAHCIFHKPYLLGVLHILTLWALWQYKQYFHLKKKIFFKKKERWLWVSS